MPLYEYECAACGHRFEIIQRFSDPPASVCPKCGSSPVHKLLSAPAFQFKGTGWYVTDYPRKGAAPPSGEAAPGSSSSGSDSGSSADGKAASPDSKSSSEGKSSSPDSKTGSSGAPAAASKPDQK